MPSLAAFSRAAQRDVCHGIAAKASSPGAGRIVLRSAVISVTGSEFSVIPAQNATGNWVKVTQRVPVRIAIDQASPRALIAGISASVKVDVRR